MTDFAVKITVRNARILRAMKARGFESQADLARYMGQSPQHINAIVNFREKPIAHGDWSNLAMDISSALHVEPEDLWPEHMRDLHVARNSAEADISAEQLAQLAAPCSLEIDKPLLAKLISVVTHPRKRAMIEARFGLNGEPEQTLEEIAKDHNVTRERVRQVEAKAIREMRQKARRMGIEVAQHPYRY